MAKIRKIRNGKLQCYKCKQWKLLSAFHKDKTRNVGYYTYCKSCTNKLLTENRHQNLTAHNAKCREKYRRNRVKVLEQQKKYNKNPKVKMRKQQYDKIYKKRTSERAWELALLRNYNLTLDDYNKLLKKQHGKCAICGKEKKLVIDHCHRTGRVRGLLCHGCNISLGHLGDTLQGLQKAIKYLTSN